MRGEGKSSRIYLFFPNRLFKQEYLYTRCFLRPLRTACGIPVTGPEIKPVAFALTVQSLNLWTARKVPLLFSCSVLSDSLWPHGLQHARIPCPSASPRACSNSCPLSWWCHPTISSSVVPFSSCLQSFSSSGSFQMSQLFALGGQSIGISDSASVLPMNIQGQFPTTLYTNLDVHF